MNNKPKDNLLSEIREKKVWSGQYDGIAFEINNWQEIWRQKQSWTYYLYIYLNRIPEQFNPESFWLIDKATDYNSITHDYFGHPIISQIDFHCGITYYEKKQGLKKDERIIKIGCDYSHYWDEGKEYIFDGILMDVENSIKDFKRLVPNYKYWCNYNGKLYNFAEGEMIDGVFRSFEGKKEAEKKHEEYLKKEAEKNK